VLNLEEMTEEELERLKAHYYELAELAQTRQHQAEQQTQAPTSRHAEPRPK
jgi:hypothetical protein